MLRQRRHYKLAACALFSGLLLCLACTYVLIESGTAHAAPSIGQLQQQISAGQSKVSSLSGAVGAVSNQLGQLNSSIAGLEQQIGRIQRDLDAKRAELLKLRTKLVAARTRLARLQAFEARAEGVLSQQLVNAYETDRPDIVSVVLESTGFKDLLERISFAQRIQKQDAQVVSWVKSTRRAVAAQATKLGALEVRQQRITQEVLSQRNNLAGSRLKLVREQLQVAKVRQQKAGQLADAKSQVADLQQQLDKAQAAQAAAAAAASQGSSSGSSGSGSSSAGSFGPPSSGGGFTFPLPKSAASPPSTWSEDQGVDISAPGDTPEYAVCSGTIVLHGIGGFGPDAPVLHCDSPVGGYDYVYYGHAGPANQLPVGTHVGAGQVMSSIGPGIVGISTGPHLEIGFSDASGSPVGGGSASTMMSLLQSSYGG
jgi:murein DD-endopeptidase MepM/ murein hydrolase activator NlpD